MKFLIESKDKYYAVNRDSAGYYSTLDEVKRDLINFIPYGEDSLSEENKVIVYSLGSVKDFDNGVTDLSYDDEIFEFYDNKLHYTHSGKVVNYVPPKPKGKKEYRLLGSDGKYYLVKGFTKIDAQRALRDYLKGR